MLHSRRDVIIRGMLAALGSVLVVGGRWHPAFAQVPGPTVAVMITQELINWIKGFKYEPANFPCPACTHAPVFHRHVGFIIGGHTQQSCPCRLIRHHGGQWPCGCEWTRDL
jgi:hypothetical protein